MDNNELIFLRKAWSHMGEQEPYFSVLTDQRFKPQNINDETLKTFYESGIQDVQWIDSILKKHGYMIKDKVVLDFGCGVGRLTHGALENGAQRVYGVDISEAHLHIAKERVPFADYYLLNENGELPLFTNKPDVIFTLIVLQHNRPHLMKKQISQLLQCLGNGGVAFLHVPYAIPHYQPDRPLVGTSMEMHFLPKDDVCDIVKENECILLEINEDRDMCGGDIKNACYVIAKQ